MYGSTSCPQQLRHLRCLLERNAIQKREAEHARRTQLVVTHRWATLLDLPAVGLGQIVLCKGRQCGPY